jgi:hypothetical protein
MLASWKNIQSNTVSPLDASRRSMSTSNFLQHGV